MLMFILLSHEIAASSLLFGPNTQALVVRSRRHAEVGTDVEEVVLNAGQQRVLGTLRRGDA